MGYRYRNSFKFIKSFGKRVIFLFLLANLVVRFSTVFYYKPYTIVLAAILGCVAAAGVIVVFFRKLLKPYLLLFGFSFFLYGVGSIDIQSRIFEMLVTLVAITLFLVNLREKSQIANAETTISLNPWLVVMSVSFTGLAVFSLMCLPLRQIISDMWMFGIPRSFFYLFIGPAYGVYYPVVAVIRLSLFLIMAVQLALTANRYENFQWLFIGIFASGVFSAFIGLLEFYGVISLNPLRFGTRMSTLGVLHSLFVNRAWFGEFVLITIPFVLIGFMNRYKKLWFTIFLFFCMILCEIALILSGGRAGWVSYPLILFFCWIFVYFFKDQKFDLNQLKWKNIIKVAVSVPTTIIISLLLVFYLLMPLSTYMKAHGNNVAMRSAASMDNFLTHRVSHMIEHNDRVGVWNKGIDVGRERWLYGLGYMTFGWHSRILASIPDSIYSVNKNNKPKNLHETPHSLYLQLFSGGGFVALFIWLMMTGYALSVLITDIVINRRLLDIPVIISIISFHVYGIFQSMQTVPMIWMIYFLCLGYAMTMDHGVLPVRLMKIGEIAGRICCVLMIIGFFVYLSNFESRKMAEKYNLENYTRDRLRTAGFLPHSERWNYAKGYRWTGKKGVVFLKNSVKSVNLSFYCCTPDVDKKPVEVTVRNGKKLLDKIIFKGKKKIIKRTYVFQIYKDRLKTGDKNLNITVSRTWEPHAYLRNFDRRMLGVGVKINSKS